MMRSATTPFIFCAFLGLFISACAEDKQETPNTVATDLEKVETTSKPNADKDEQAVDDILQTGLVITEQPSNNSEPLSSTPMITMTTNKGVIKLELDGENAPETTANFVQYAQAGFYDGLIFHRVIPGFMIQGGGFTSEMSQKSTQAPIQNEADNGLKNDKYSIAMARTSDPHSATAQFFINTSDNDFLNFKSADMNGYGYAVFGKVVEGIEVVDSIEKVSTTRVGPHGDVPVEAVIIESVTVD